MTLASPQQWLTQVPNLPAELILADQSYDVQKVLRLLPKRRITVLAKHEQRAVVLKVFAAEGKGQQEFQRELAAHQHCVEANIAVPAIVSHSLPDAALHHISYAFISAGKTFNQTTFDTQRHGALFRLFAACHDAQCYQDDPHLDNFIDDGETVFLLDLASVVLANKPLSLSICLRNLARLVAQWPIEDEATLCHAMSEYFAARKLTETAALQAAFGQYLSQARAARQRHYLKKQLRPCTMTQYQRSLSLEAAWRPQLTAVLKEAPVVVIEQAMAKGRFFKKGNTATVILGDLADQSVVIKRYNIKNVVHFLRRSLRPSRARHSWMMANLLVYLSIPTPEPLAFIEQRHVGLRGKAYFICQAISGKTLDTLDPEALIAPTLLAQLSRLFVQLRQHRIVHGDLKATNLMVDTQGKLWLIDLDAVKQETNAEFAKQHQADQQRFLKNWLSHEHYDLLSKAIQ